MMFSARKETSV